MRSLRTSVLIALILQANLSTAFLGALLNGLFGGGLFGGQPNGIQPSIYAPVSPNNQGKLQQAQARAWPTTNIAGAFDNPPRIGIFGAVASIVDAVIRATGNILSALGGGPFSYGAMIPQNTNNNGTTGNGNSTEKDNNDKKPENPDEG